MTSKRTLTICAAILAVAACLSALIFVTEPTAKRVAATRETAMRVQVTEVRRGTYRPTIVAMGTVRPAQEITLGARVSGEVVSLSPAFAPGGFAPAGEMLLRIDPADYENAVLQRKSDLRQAVADLNVEMGRQNVAQKDYQLLGESLAPELEALVLRRPQLNAARARVEAARAAVRQAELELARTRITAPFDAHVLDRTANVGSQVSPGQSLGHLVGVDSYWVVTTVPVTKVAWLDFPEDGGEGAPVRVRDRAAWAPGVYRTGSLYRLVGSLESRTRMARVIVTVPDPLVRQKNPDDRPPLMIGSFVETRIEAREIPDVVRLNRDYVRADNTVWVMEDGRLGIRQVDIVFRDAAHAYIAGGLSDRDRVVTTNLATVIEGAPLRLKEDPEERTE